MNFDDLKMYLIFLKLLCIHQRFPTARGCIYLFMWPHVWPQDFFFVVQKYSNQGVSCRNIKIRVFRAEIFIRYRYALPSHTRLTIWIGPNAMFILFQVPLINKNGTKSMHCIIRGKV